MSHQFRVWLLNVFMSRAGVPVKKVVIGYEDLPEDLPIADLDYSDVVVDIEYVPRTREAAVLVSSCSPFRVRVTIAGKTVEFEPNGTPERPARSKAVLRVKL